MPDSSRRRERLLAVEHANVVNERALRLCKREPRIQTRIIRDGCLLFHIHHRARRRHQRLVDITSATSVFRISRNSHSELIEILEAPRRHAPRFSRGNHERERLSLDRKWYLETDHTLGKRKQRELGRNNDPQSSFASNKPIDWLVRECVASRVFLQARTPKLDDITRCKNDGQRTYVLAGRTVFKSSRT